MKTFIRTIIVLVVLNLATGCFATAQNAPGEGDPEAAKKEIEAAKEEMEKAGQKMKEAGQKMKETAQYDMAQRLAKAAEREQKRLLRLLPTPPRIPATLPRIPGVGRSRSLTDRHDGSGQVFVIPAAEIKAQDLVTIMEDMSVMARIFDKKLGRSHTGLSSFFGSLDFYDHLPYSHDGRATERIYLQGYGALFLMKADFPLSPTVEAEEKEIEEEADLLWEETKQEIYTPEDVRRETRRRRSEQKQQYDAEKVEELKNKLIKALKHAANIRNLKPDESIIITVTGEGDQVSGTIRLLVKQSTIDADEDKEVRVYEAPSSEEMSFPSTTVMTIRVKKSDVDAFAKGKLDFDKFRQKVQIFTY